MQLDAVQGGFVRVAVPNTAAWRRSYGRLAASEGASVAENAAVLVGSRSRERPHLDLAVAGL
jgi:hypothetical protein